MDRVALRKLVQFDAANEIVLGKRAITAATALRLGRFFGTSERLARNDAPTPGVPR